MTSEPVYAAWEYYDGVRTGVANFMGEPYVFAQEWSESQQAYLPTYSLTPNTKQVLSLVLEQWRIFRAWEIAFHNGKVEASTHPGLLGKGARRASQCAALIDTGNSTAGGVAGATDSHWPLASRCRRRQPNSRLALMPWAIAMAATDTPGTRQSSTSSRLNSSL